MTQNAARLFRYSTLCAQRNNSRTSALRDQEYLETVGRVQKNKLNGTIKERCWKWGAIQAVAMGQVCYDRSMRSNAAECEGRCAMESNEMT
jgi:hypothetical protein